MAAEQVTQPVNRGQAGSQREYPDWGNIAFPTGLYPEGSQGKQWEDLLRATVHCEVTTSQCKHRLTDIYGKRNFAEKRQMRAKWHANDLARQLSEEDSTCDKSDKICECLLVHCQQASLLSVLCCPVLSIGYMMSYCKASKAAHLAILARAAEELEYESEEAEEANTWDPFYAPIATAPLQQSLLRAGEN